MILCITKRGARLSNISHEFKSYNTLMAFTKCARVCGNLIRKDLYEDLLE
jgi:hypothetical protein